MYVDSEGNEEEPIERRPDSHSIPGTGFPTIRYSYGLSGTAIRSITYQVLFFGLSGTVIRIISLLFGLSGTVIRMISTCEDTTGNSFDSVPLNPIPSSSAAEHSLLVGKG